MNDLDKKSDEELIILHKSGASRQEELISRYTPYVRFLARPYFLAGGDAEDLIQEGMMDT